MEESDLHSVTSVKVGTISIVFQVALEYGNYGCHVHPILWLIIAL